MAPVKTVLKKGLIKAVNSLGLNSKYIGSPKSFITTETWIKKNKSKSIFFTEIFPPKNATENPPITIDDVIPKAFKKEYNRQQPQAFVAGIYNGRVWGRNGSVITPDDLLLSDVSREFGKIGGNLNKEHSVFQQLKLFPVKYIQARVAVVACSGSFNYFHWLYDTLPRIGLLKKAGIFESIDYFIIDYTDLKFQKDSLEILGVPQSKIIRCNDNWNFHIQATELIIPSLPSHLGSTSDWTINFLRETFLPVQTPVPEKKLNIYLSRKKATLRFLINEKEILDILEEYNFIPFFAEDHSIPETAKYFSECKTIVGLHGAGFANLPFCTAGTKVIDIIAPKHYDTNFWILANHRALQFAYIFGEGEQLPEDTDLVKNKINDDIYVNPDKFKLLIEKLNLE